MTGAISAALSSSAIWPPPLTVCRLAPGISAAMIWWFTSGATGSSSPATTSVGCPMVHSHGRLVQPNSGAIRYRAVTGFAGRWMCIERTRSGSVRSRPPNMSPATRSSRCGWNVRGWMKCQNACGSPGHAKPPNVVEASTRRRTRAGCEIAVCWASAPPNDWPSTWAESMPSSSSTSMPRRASAGMLSGQAAICERPIPGGSKAIVRNPCRWGSRLSHIRTSPQTPEYSSSGSPSPRIWAWIFSPLIRICWSACCGSTGATGASVTFVVASGPGKFTVIT